MKDYVVFSDEELEKIVMKDPENDDRRLAYAIISKYCDENGIGWREKINWLKEVKHKLCAVRD